MTLVERIARELRGSAWPPVLVQKYDLWLLVTHVHGQAVTRVYV